jgi:RNA polymerase sigma factor (sigma-70 family)
MDCRYLTGGVGKTSPLAHSGATVMSDDSVITSAAMLEDMRDPNNRAAWAKFFSRYEKKILGWCRSRGLQAADAEDISQNVMLILYNEIQKFTYDPAEGRFRGWLSVITHRACLAFLTRSESRKYRQLLCDIVAGENLEEMLEEQANSEVFHAALEQVRKNVTGRDWQIFCRKTFDRRTARQLTEEFAGLEVAAVHKIVSRVRRKVIDQAGEFGGTIGALEFKNDEMSK